MEEVARWGERERERERHVSDASWHNCENSKDRLTRAWPRDIDCSNLSNEKIIKWIEDECIMEHEDEGWEGMRRTRWRRGGGKEAVETLRRTCTSPFFFLN